MFAPSSSSDEEGEYLEVSSSSSSSEEDEVPPPALRKSGAKQKRTAEDVIDELNLLEQHTNNLKEKRAKLREELTLLEKERINVRVLTKKVDRPAIVYRLPRTSTIRYLLSRIARDVDAKMGELCLVTLDDNTTMYRNDALNWSMAIGDFATPEKMNTENTVIFLCYKLC